MVKVRSPISYMGGKFYLERMGDCEGAVIPFHLLRGGRHLKWREKMRRAKKKKTRRKELELELDRVWHEKVLERDKKKCRICGKTDRLQSHHIFSRTHRATRWDLDNGITLCAGHHYWAHREPEKFRQFVIGLMGEEKYQRIFEKSQHSVKFSIQDLEDLLNNLKGVKA